VTSLPYMTEAAPARAVMTKTMAVGDTTAVARMAYSSRRRT
jgi:hypothetical protein